MPVVISNKTTTSNSKDRRFPRHVTKGLTYKACSPTRWKTIGGLVLLSCRTDLVVEVEVVVVVVVVVGWGGRYGGRGRGCSPV